MTALWLVASGTTRASAVGGIACQAPMSMSYISMERSSWSSACSVVCRGDRKFDYLLHRSLGVLQTLPAQMGVRLRSQGYLAVEPSGQDMLVPMALDNPCRSPRMRSPKM